MHNHIDNVATVCFLMNPCNKRRLIKLGEFLLYLQYREPGVLLWRGFTLQEFANQCFGNKSDYGKGRQMPVHYGSNKLNYFTVSATIA